MGLGLDIEPTRLAIGSARYGLARYGSLYKWTRRLARLWLDSELELARLAHEPKHKNTVHRDYNSSWATNTSHAYLKWNKQSTYEFYNGVPGSLLPCSLLHICRQHISSTSSLSSMNTHRSSRWEGEKEMLASCAWSCGNQRWRGEESKLEGAEDSSHSEVKWQRWGDP